MTQIEGKISWRQRFGSLIAGESYTQEIIGRYVAGNTQLSVIKSKARLKTVDETVPDYAWLDKLRRSKAVGYSLSSLFCRRIERVYSSWTLALGVTVRLKDRADDLDDPDDPRNHTDAELAGFIASLLESPEDMGDDIDREGGRLQSILEDTYGLGDQYVIINPDCTISVPSPDTVEEIRSDIDYREILADVVTSKSNKLTVTDSYTKRARTITVKEDGKQINLEVFPNLIGRIPVVHLANDRSSNETNGRSVHEALRALYDQYDDVFYKMLDGVKILGNPLLVFEGMDDIDAVINANDPNTQETYPAATDGSTTERTQITIDQNAVILIGKGGSVKFAAPPVGFTTDTMQALKALFLLLLDHTGIPEFIWGNELTSSRSSAEVQLTQFTRDIASRQQQISGALNKLCTIWLQCRSLTDPNIIVDTLEVKWPKLITDDKETLLKVVQFAKDRGLLTARTALMLLELVDDPGIETSEAEEEFDERQAKSAALEAKIDDFPGRLRTDSNLQDENPDGSNV